MQCSWPIMCSTIILILFTNGDLHLIYYKSTICLGKSLGSKIMFDFFFLFSEDFIYKINQQNIFKLL